MTPADEKLEQLAKGAVREPTAREIHLFKRACQTLADLAALGFTIYVYGTGNINLMRGPTHDESPRANALYHNVIESCYVPGAAGGDW